MVDQRTTCRVLVNGKWFGGGFINLVPVPGVSNSNLIPICQSGVPSTMHHSIFDV